MNTGSLAPQRCDLGGASPSAKPQVEREFERVYDDLQSLVEQTGAMPPDAAADCIRQALTRLKHAHEQRRTYGSLSPADLLLDPDGVLSIADRSCEVVSSPGEFSASTIRDLRCLGAVLSWLLCGKAPALQATNVHSGNGAATVELFRGAEFEVPEPLAALFQRLSTAGRPQGFSSVAEALAFLDESLAANEAAPAPPCSCGSQEAPCCAAMDRIEAPTAVMPQADATADESPAPNDSRRAAVWLYGSLALTAAMLLALLSYFLWR